MLTKIFKNNFYRSVILVLGFSLCFAVNHAYGQDTLPEKFINLLQKSGMSVNIPDSFKVVPVMENKQMNYDYAVKHVSKDLEIRYAIRPDDPNTSAMYAAIFVADLANISGKPASAELASSVKILPKESVSKEFNADWAAFAMVKPANEFGEGYDFCAVVAIHKKNKGDGYIFCLSHVHQDIGPMLKTAFDSLTFK